MDYIKSSKRNVNAYDEVNGTLCNGECSL